MDLSTIYSNYDKEIVEANKKLPKPCFGNSHGCYCEYTCPKREGCYEVTMQKWGPCNCKFKLSCHLARQGLQVEWKTREPEHICNFLKYFDETNYPDITIPEGIIKMQPIRD